METLFTTRRHPGGFAATAANPSTRRTPVDWHSIAPLLSLGVALVLLYIPTFAQVAQTFWTEPTNSHGPIILVVTAWLFFSGIKAHRVESNPPDRPRRVLGSICLLFGLTLYLLGRPQALSALEVASLIPTLLGCTLILSGASLARRLGFAFFFTLFLIPLPGSVVDALTQPLKMAVSCTTELVLHAAGYPVARAGVVLSIGQYQLLVADACAGLNSLFMLEAFGLLYLNLVRHPSPLRNAVLALFILPISFVANVTRVSALALITHYFGDAAGQGFVHGFSAMILFAAALLLIIPLDNALRAFARLAASRRSLPAARSLV